MNNDQHKTPDSALSTAACSILGVSTELKITTTRRDGYIDCKLEFELPQFKIVENELWVFPASNTKIAHSEQNGK